MLPFIISKKEVQNYFNESFGYETIDNFQILYVYCQQTKDFFYLPSRDYYWKGLIWLTLLVNKELLQTSFRTEWYRFMYFTFLNRLTNKQTKNQ